MSCVGEPKTGERTANAASRVPKRGIIPSLKQLAVLWLMQPGQALSPEGCTADLCSTPPPDPRAL